MTDRMEAIRWLNEQGYIAFARDWVVGESIGIAKRKVEASPGIWVLEPTVIYVHPALAGGWVVFSASAPSQDATIHGLREAVAHAIQLLESREVAQGTIPNSDS